MIVEYHRPDSIEEVLKLLQRDLPTTYPLGGGTVLNRKSPESYAVVDLQALQLDRMITKGKYLQIGATVTLQDLHDGFSDDKRVVPNLPDDFKAAINLEGSYNLRQVATVAGTLVAGDGRSAFTTSMLAMDATLILKPDDEVLKLGDLLPLREERLSGRVIIEVRIPTNINFAYQYIARTPGDLAIVSIAISRWPSGRTRVALGGYSDAPLLAFDGTEPDGAEIAARDAFSMAEDEWASAGYRSEMAALLTSRCLKDIGAVNT